MDGFAQPSGPKYHHDLVQGSGDWLQARCGLLTASEMKLIITPTLKVASNEKERTHLFELLAQRVTGYVEESYQGFDMLRGHEDEIDAKLLYAANYAPVTDGGFITNDSFGFTLGFSPDGLVGDDGLIESKSRRHKFQVETIINNAVPDEHVIQVQTGMLVSGRKWCDFISYSAGLPMAVMRVLPDPEIQDAIIKAATAFEERIAQKMEAFKEALATRRFIATKRRIEQEIYL
jgi:hypothetical protein